MIQMLKLFEAELGDKKYFGGDTFGFVDVAFVPFTSWFDTYGSVWIGVGRRKEGKKWEEVPGAGKCGKDTYEPSKTYEFVCFLKKYYGIE
ncbi:Glutathione S-transferase [Rhynchospora pubera]|uniref:Glutathione S-transferase n=1 Tax=Rhynchospora pubera TaxID=906938 RepID=A0AAV8H812_9POAL|nr:Glutathione S-transferase [Rhynchospora pubera]